MIDLDTILNEDGSVNWDPDHKYTPAELDEISTLILRHDVRNGGSIKGENPILFKEHLMNRGRREIYTSIGTPDPAFGHGIYNRSHPEGRKVNSDEQRKRNGAGYYR